MLLSFSCVCVFACASQSPYWASSSVTTLHLSLWERVSHWAWCSPMWLHRLATNTLGSSSVYLPSSRITGAHCCSCFVHECWGLNLGLHACVVRSLPTEPFPCPLQCRVTFKYHLGSITRLFWPSLPILKYSIRHILGSTKIRHQHQMKSYQRGEDADRSSLWRWSS